MGTFFPTERSTLEGLPCMTSPRSLSDQERSLIVALLTSKSEPRDLIESLDGLSVTEMNDGGMGSLLLAPRGKQTAPRSFGKELVVAAANDYDGVPLSIALNLDNHGNLYELDVWKVDFSPLQKLPDPREIKIIR
jgi:hypothetical protein